MTSPVIEKPLPRQGRERVLTRGATLLRSIGRLILTRCANGHSRGNYTYLYVSIKACWFPDSQATFGPSAPRKTYSLCDLPSLAEICVPTPPAQRLSNRFYSFATYSLMGRYEDVK